MTSLTTEEIAAPAICCPAFLAGCFRLAARTARYVRRLAQLAEPAESAD